jgi:cysteine desulfurase
MTEPTVYLDHNATTTLRPGVLDLIAHILGETGNASSVHGFGRIARKHVEDARAQIAKTVDVDPAQVIFNSGATEGNNTILKGFAGQRILVSAIEHPSVINSGVPVETFPVTADGVVDLAAFEKILKSGPSPALVSCMLVNNETGIVQPVADVARMAKEMGCLVHCDAVQALGRLSFTRKELGVDFLTLSSHKIGGPQGVGAVVMAPGAKLPRLLHGGGQEKNMRAGTENVAGIAGFGLAAESAIKNISDFAALETLRAKIETHISVSPIAVSIHGQNAPRVSNTISLSPRGAPSFTVQMALDLDGIAVSGGSACSSGSIKPSRVLSAMGLSDADASNALRISLGWNTSAKDVEIFLTAWDKVAAQVTKRAG